MGQAEGRPTADSLSLVSASSRTTDTLWDLEGGGPYAAHGKVGRSPPSPSSLTSRSASSPEALWRWRRPTSRLMTGQSVQFSQQCMCV